MAVFGDRGLNLIRLKRFASCKTCESVSFGKYYEADAIILKRWTPAIGTWLMALRKASSPLRILDSGTFDGNGFSISNLYINRSSTSVGLFSRLSGVEGQPGVLRNVKLVDANVTGFRQVGLLVGTNNKGGVIENCTVSGRVTGVNRPILIPAANEEQVVASYPNEIVGGLVGDNNGTIRDSKSTDITVIGAIRVGGLVGINHGVIENGFASGIANGNNFYVGGLAGCNGGCGDATTTGTIRNSSASVSVFGSFEVRNTGGLVGQNGRRGTITESYATGAVSGHTRTGGLAGLNSGNISGSYATGTVDGLGNVVGGLAGANNNGNIIDSYATGAVKGSDKWVGGLAGINYWHYHLTATQRGHVTGN